MTSRKTRKQIAEQTLQSLTVGSYLLADGTEVSIASSLEDAKRGTRVYSPSDLEGILNALPDSEGHATTFRVQNMTTFAGTRSLLQDDPDCDPFCLNFASAKNPGGGFLNGSQAQEESLARASGLYACIEPMRDYYASNRACGTALYTHYMIYSPRVPVFRDDEDQPLQQPYRCSILTAPAVNAGAVRKNEGQRTSSVEGTMLERIERVLAIALINGHDTLVLGAWGCGVFRNDPTRVARWFRHHLVDNHQFRGAFRQVLFAVLDHSQNLETLAAFEKEFKDLV